MPAVPGSEPNDADETPEKAEPSQRTLFKRAARDYESPERFDAALEVVGRHKPKKGETQKKD